MKNLIDFKYKVVGNDDKQPTVSVTNIGTELSITPKDHELIIKIHLHQLLGIIMIRFKLYI